MTSEHRPFASPTELRAWLAANHASEGELWIRVRKVGSGIPSVTWTDCVVEALSFGWIDGIRKSFDDDSYLQRLTPRRPGSTWSEKNRAHAERLIAEGLMTPAGMEHVDAARADGRWEAAYAGSAGMVIPQDFLEGLETRPKAKLVFAGLDRRNLYTIYHRLQTAKRPETRSRRLERILDRLDRGERFH